MMKRNPSLEIVILGAGQQGRVCKALAEENGFGVAAFVDDYENGPVEGVPVYRNIIEIGGYERYLYFVAIGEIKPRKKFIAQMRGYGLKTLNLIDKDAVISEGVVIGTGNFISKFAVLYPGVKVGDFNIINTHAVVATDCIVGNNNNISLSCNICGGSEVGNNNYIGCSSSIVNASKVENDCVIGAGAVVLRDVEDGKFFCGIPAIEKVEQTAGEVECIPL